MEHENEKERDSRTKRVLRKVGLTAAYAAGFAPWAAFLGVSTASTEDYFGPNETTYEVAVDPWSTLDLGPLGTATAPITAGPFAVEATMHDIPGGSDIDQTAFFSHVTDQYALQYKYRRDYGDTITNLLLHDAEKKSIYYELGWLGVVGLGSLILNERTRRHLTPLATTGIAISVLAGTLAATTEGHSAPQPGYDITGLSGVKTESGTILFGANQAIPSMRNFIRRQEATGDTFVDGVREQLEPYTALMQQKEDGEIVIFAFSDIHCSIVQTGIFKSVADIYQPDVTINAGDSTTNGLRVEEKCIDNIASIRDGIVVTDGNHDSSVTQEQEEDRGMNVLKGETISVGGVSILGDKDPERTPAFGSGPTTRYSTTGETEEELGERLRATAIEDGADIVVVHQPKAARAFLDDASKVPIKFLLWGHEHHLESPEVYWREGGGYTVAQQLGTAGGIGQQTFDSLSTPLTTPTIDATAVAYRYNPSTGQVLTQAVTVTPDGELTVSTWQAVVTTQDIISHTSSDIPLKGSAVAGASKRRGFDNTLTQ